MRRLLAARVGAGKPGRGAITRGRGDAFLGLTNETEGATAGLEAKKLPRGAVVPRSWERVGISRVAPTLGPERSTALGSAGTEGAGEAAWRRRLAPHHREAVRAYFGGQEGGAPESDTSDGEDGR